MDARSRRRILWPLAALATAGAVALLSPEPRPPRRPPPPPRKPLHDVPMSMSPIPERSRDEAPAAPVGQDAPARTDSTNRR